MSQSGSSIPFTPRTPLSPIKSVQNQPVQSIRFTPVLTNVDTPLISRDRKNESLYSLPVLEYPNPPKKRRKGGHEGFYGLDNENLSGPSISPFSHQFSPGTSDVTPSSTFPANVHPFRGRGSKRKSTAVDEFRFFDISTPSPTPAKSNRPTESLLSLEQKLSLVIEYAGSLGLTFPNLLYEFFRTPSASEKDHWNTEDHRCFSSRAAVVSKFLRGQSSHTVSNILDLWIRHKYGAGSRDSDEMYSFASDRPYTLVRPVRPALTSFAIQIVMRKLVLQMREAVKPSSGLHVDIPTSKNPIGSSHFPLDWRNFGVQNFQHITNIHRRVQPLLWGILQAVSTPDLYRLHPENNERKHRPIEVVVSTVISKLAFSRSPAARIGPLQDALFNVATNASYEKFRYDSHVGNCPSLPTTLRAMLGLSESAAVHCLDLGQDPGMWFWIVLDNVQNYIRRRVQQLGRDNWMNLGMAGTLWARKTGAQPRAFDYEDKQKRRSQCRRDQIKTGQLLRLLDDEHEHRVFAFQWLWVLGNYIPCLKHLKSRANELLRTEGRRQKVTDEPSICFPLPTTSGSETQLEEFLASLLDFFQSCGQTAERFHKRMLPVCGDGFTFELLLKLMEHRQLHTSPFHSLRIMSPVLAWWHTQWTNDARIVDNHLVNYASLDPSTLGHSASKISRKLSKEQGKYNYHQATDLMYLVADARMLDCWRLLLMRVATENGVNIQHVQDIFDVVEALDKASQVPTTEQLEKYAYELHDKYTTEEAIYRAAHGKEDSRVPHCQSAEDSSTRSQILRELDCAATAIKTPTAVGDSVLARSKDFMREVIRSRELVWSIAEGDVGRAWEQMKPLMFCMAGSSHKKYAHYLLVSIIDLHFESSSELREAILSTAVASLNGLPGCHRPVDILQEWLQRILEAIVQHKGAEFGSSFIRNHVARNLRALGCLKEESISGIGLGKHSQRHSKPTNNAEMRILLQEYRETNLHSFNEGRRSTDLPDKVVQSQFMAGVEGFDTFLRKHTTRMVHMQDVQLRKPSLSPSVEESNADATTTNSDLDNFMSESDDHCIDTPIYFRDVHDGDITTHEMDIVASTQELISGLVSGNFEEAEDNTFIDNEDIGNSGGVIDGFQTEDDEV